MTRESRAKYKRCPPMEIETAIHALTRGAFAETEDKLVLKGDVLAKYFPRTYTPSQKQKIIVKLLEDWHKRQLRQQER